jgi:hypothetical protein
MDYSHYTTQIDILHKRLQEVMLGKRWGEALVINGKIGELTEDLETWLSGKINHAPIQEGYRSY